MRLQEDSTGRSILRTTRLRPFVGIVLLMAGSLSAAEIHVSPTGDDADSGTRGSAAANLCRGSTGGTAAARPRPCCSTPARTTCPRRSFITPDDSGTTYASAARRTRWCSAAACKLDLQWQPYRDGILQAETPAGLAIDQLFVNGQRQHMARYPNFDPDARPYNGAAADAFSPQRAARWADPAGGFIHAMHRAHWGGYHYRITGKNEQRRSDLRRRLAEQPPDGHAPAGPLRGEHLRGTRRSRRVVPRREDARRCTSTRRPDVRPGRATVEVVRLRHLVEFQGSRENPVRSVSLRGFAFRHAARTFMDVKEPLLRSDWTIYRGGAVLFNGAEDCAIADCEFDQLGGNADLREQLQPPDSHHRLRHPRHRGQRRRVRRRSPGRPQSAVRVPPASELCRHRQDTRDRRPTTIRPIAPSRTA